MLIPQPAHRAADDVLHLSRRVVVLCQHLVEMRLAQMAMQLHARVGESTVWAFHWLIADSLSLTACDLAQAMHAVSQLPADTR
jgi:hypothetical protein